MIKNVFELSSGLMTDKYFADQDRCPGQQLVCPFGLNCCLMGQGINTQSQTAGNSKTVLD